MKLTTIITLALAMLGSIACAADSALEAFAQKYAKAKDSGDAATLEAMHYLEGASPEERAKVREQVAMSLKYKNPDNHTAVTLEAALDEHMEFTRIFKGEKTEPSLPPVGMIKLAYPKGAHMTPYGLKDGQPWLIGLKITKLDWNGPAEDHYQVSVRNKGDQAVKFTLECSYQASGQSLQMKKHLTVQPHGFNGSSVLANDLNSVRITTTQPDMKLEGSINRNDQGRQIELLKQEFSADAAFSFEGKAAP